MGETAPWGQRKKQDRLNPGKGKKEERMSPLAEESD
jgi:hypothetical protein